MCESRRSVVSFIVLWWIFIVCQGTESTKETFPRQFDFRYTSYEELVEQAPLFSHTDIVGFTQLTLDEDNDQLLVGARDSIFRLSLDNLDVIEHSEFVAQDRKSCIDKGQMESSCHNYIRVLLLHNYTKTDPNSDIDHAVFICGTNAFSPFCTWRPVNNISQIIHQSSGIGKCPYDPNQNSTAIITTDGNIYGATNIGRGDRDPAIYRSNGPKSKDLRTAQANSKWLNEPDFVSSYEIGDLVYFFFREVAVEYINCGKRIYSRVARLCKSDPGGIFENTWTTFFKSRLNCSLPGKYPFYYDELQATFLLEDGTERYIYAVFNTPVNSIAGSAVCVYNITALETSFTGPFKYQESPRSAWERHEQPENGQKPLTQCPEKKDQSKRSHDNHSMDESKYQLMDDAVQPETLVPLVHADNERWTHVVVDNVKGKQGHYKVVFVATADGKIRKLTTLSLPTENKTCLIEEIKIVPNGEHRPVKAMRISSQEMALYISTQHNVIKVPVHRCERFENSDLCLNANDPYCGWDDNIGECATAPSGQPEVHYWSQSMSACPFVPHAVNGGWSEWTGWDSCSQVGGDATAGECRCRSRSCDNPKPYYGGQSCVGASVEITNCTAHGQWTEWTSWSACSQTCGSMATRQRHRYCSNPPPRFGGRGCIGPDSEEDYCQGHPPCPLPPVKGNWTMWADWSECSARCNGGIQTRRRSCIEPPAPVDSIPCAGNTQEWRMCNTQICEMLNQMTPWTPWVATNHTKGGYFEERFRFMCQAKVPSQTMIQSKHIKTQARFCFDGGQCHDSDVALVNDIDGGWSNWSAWSSCSRDCDGGLRWRRRECNNPQPLGKGHDCHGHAMEGQECNSHPCQGVWSCWSAMSSCSATCGSGIMVRSRECDSLPPGNKYIIPCEGNREETIACNTGPCVNVALSSSMSGGFMQKPRFSLAQMFLVGGLSFFLGGSASIALYCYVSSFRRAMKDAKQNDRKRKLERKMSEQKQLTKRQSQTSVRTVPSMSSHIGLEDGFHAGRSRFYDVETVVRDSPNRASTGVSRSTPSQVSLDNVFIGGRSRVYDVENIMSDGGQEEPYYSTIDKKCALKTFTIKDL